MVNWKLISKLGKNRFVNNSYIYLFFVPILAKLLNKINSPLLFQIGDKTHVLILELPFSWALFYFSALFFTVASIVYNYKVPTIIQENNSFGDFLNDRKGMLHLFEYCKDLSLDAIEMVDANKGTSSGYTTESSLKKLEDEQLRDRFWWVYNKALTARRSFIRISFVNYAIGIFLIILVMIQGTANVLEISNVDKFKEMFCSICSN